MLVLEWKGRAFIEKVNSRCFCWFPEVILVDKNGPPRWRLHTKLYKVAWNVSSNNSESVGDKDLRLGQIVYILVFYNILLSWLLPLDGFQFFFCVTVKTSYSARCSSLDFGSECLQRRKKSLSVFVLDSKTKEDDKIVLQSVGFEISREWQGLLLQSRKNG